MDWENVEVTTFEQEVNGYIVLEEIQLNSKSFDDKQSNRIKQSEYERLQKIAAFMGGNAILLTKGENLSHYVGSEFSAGQTTKSLLKAIILTNHVHELEKIKSVVSSKDIILIREDYIPERKNEIQGIIRSNLAVKFDKIYEREKFVIVEAKIPGLSFSEYRISIFNDDSLILFKEENDVYYNYTLSIQ